MKLTPELRENIADATVDAVMEYMNRTKKWYAIGTIIGHGLVKFCRVGSAVANNAELMDEIAESTRRMINNVLDEGELLTDLAKKDPEFSEAYIEMFEYLEELKGDSDDT